MKTIIKIIISLALVYMLFAFAFGSWCAYNSFAIGDVTLSLIHATFAVVDLFCLISTILLFTK